MKLYLFSYQSYLWQKMQNTIDIKKNLRSLHLAFWNPFAHLLQFPKKGLQTSLLWQWSLHRNWQFRPYSPGLHAKNYTKNNWSKFIRIRDFIYKMTHKAISFNNKTSFLFFFFKQDMHYIEKWLLLRVCDESNFQQNLFIFFSICF